MPPCAVDPGAGRSGCSGWGDGVFPHCEEPEDEGGPERSREGALKIPMSGCTDGNLKQASWIWISGYEKQGVEYTTVLRGSMTDHAMGAGHPGGRVAELDSQSALCPGVWGRPG